MSESQRRSDKGGAILGCPKQGGTRMRRTSRGLIVLVALSLLAGAGPLGAADAPTKVGPAPVAAPELARFNDLLAGLAESLKPAIVHVRVRRAAPVRDRDREEPEGEPRRSTGSGFIID